MQTVNSQVQMEKYSRGRRGAPAKGVGRVYPAREFKSLLLRMKRQSSFEGCLFILSEGMRTLCKVYTKDVISKKIAHLAAVCEPKASLGCSTALLLRHLRATKKIAPGKALIFQGFFLFRGEIFMFDFVDEKRIFFDTEHI